MKGRSRRTLNKPFKRKNIAHGVLTQTRRYCVLWVDLSKNNYHLKPMSEKMKQAWFPGALPGRRKLPWHLWPVRTCWARPSSWRGMGRDWRFLSDQSCLNDINFESIFREAENILKTFCEAGDVQKTQTLKSRVVTFVFRQLSSLLCLSKKQNNKIVEYLKHSMVFITPDCENVAKRIFASYDSCRRQSLKEAGKKH